jgi:hypothetical protein
MVGSNLTPGGLLRPNAEGGLLRVIKIKYINNAHNNNNNNKVLFTWNLNVISIKRLIGYPVYASSFQLKFI